MLRALSTLSLALLAVVGLLRILGAAGVSARLDHRQVELVGGVLAMIDDPPRVLGPLDRPFYSLSIGRQGMMGIAAAAVPKRTVPVTLVGWAAGALFVGSSLPLYLSFRRRRRRMLCLDCGYPRRIVIDGTNIPCAECGRRPAESRLRARALPGLILRDAALLTTAAAFAFAAGAAAIELADQRAESRSAAEAADPSWYLRACSPRLSGMLLVARPGSGPDSLNAAVAKASRGSVIILLPGKHDLADRRSPFAQRLDDLWLIGAGPEKTTLKLRIERCARLRLESLTIDCDNAPFLDSRGPSTLFLRSCRITNYNSGAGGSNSLYAQESAILADNCEFEGRTGRASGNGRGEAFDLRGRARAFLRHCTFTDNGYISRSFPGVLDGCTISTAPDRGGVANFWAPSGPNLLERGTDYKTKPQSPPSTTAFAEALDDPSPLGRLLELKSPRAYTDPIAQALARTLRIDADPEFWRGLLLHPSAEVRGLAAKALALPEPGPAGDLGEALRHLDTAPMPWVTAAPIILAGDGARPQLESIRSTGTPQERAHAEALQQLIDLKVPLADLLRAEPLRGPPSLAWR